MTAKKNLKQQISAGDIIKPWLSLGPFYEDVSDRVHSASLFESADSERGAVIVEEAVSQAQAIFEAAPYEGKKTTFRGHTARWSLVRRPDAYLTWGIYHPPHHLVTALLTTVVTTAASGLKQWRLVTLIASRILVTVNGKVVADLFAAPGEHHEHQYVFSFDAELDAGDNVVNVVLIRIGRMSRVGFRLEVTDDDVEARVPLAEGLSDETRLQVEEQVTSIRLARTIFYPSQDVGFHLGANPAPGTTLKVQLQNEDRRLSFRAQLKANRDRVCHKTIVEASGDVVVCRGNEIQDGTYNLVCVWENADGNHITSVQYAVVKVAPVEAPQGYEQLNQRKQMILEHFADLPGAGTKTTIWRETALYALGRYDEINQQVIRDTCKLIKSSVTGSDFQIQAVLRMMMWERQEQHLSDEVNALMNDAILNYKFWSDEPGPSKYFGSENHRLMYHVAELIAGEMFPVEEFTNSRQRGLYHATKGRMFVTEWLRQRGRFGFDEWHSNTYFGADFPPIVNLYDFANYADHKLKQMAKAALDYLAFILAADTFGGILGTSHGRSYSRSLVHPDRESTSAICWLLYGAGSLHYLSSTNATVSLATSSYTPPAFLTDMAHDTEATVESKVRQGVLRGSPPHANFIIYRTPDYQISGLQDHRKGEMEHSIHPAQVTLKNKNVIFWSCPYTSDEGGGQRPDYWSGNASQPRVIQARNVMSLTFHLDNWAWMSHALFEQSLFDEAILKGNWAFARVDQGYVGIYSQNGYEVGDYGRYAGRELICYAQDNTWLVECGRKVDWGSFDAFVGALTSAKIEANDDIIAYSSPSVGKFVTGWDVQPTVGGQPIELRRYPMVDSPWAHANFGSGRLAVTYGDEVAEIWLTL